MADALRILDLLGQTSAAGALMTAIALITAEPEAWANDEMTAALFIDRYEAYRQAVDQQRTDPKWLHARPMIFDVGHSLTSQIIKASPHLNHSLRHGISMTYARRRCYGRTSNQP